MTQLTDVEEPSDLQAIFATPTIDATVAAVAHHYLEVRRAKEDAESKLSDMNTALTTAEWTLLAKLDEQGLKSVKVEDVDGRPTHLSAMTATSYRLAGDLDAVRAWVIEHGGAPIIRENVPWQSFEAFCRELAGQGEKLPESVRVTERRVVRVKRD